MNLAYKSLRLLVPSMTQGNAKTGGNDWCGRTSAAMVHNYYHALKKTGFKVINDNTRGNLYHVGGELDGERAAMTSGGGYSPSVAVAAGIKAFGLTGDIRRVNLYPPAKRDATPSIELSPEESLRFDYRGVELLQDLFRYLEAFHPVVIYTMFTTGPTHIVVASGYRVDKHGIWLRIDDPANCRPPSAKSKAPSSDAGEGKTKFTKYDILVGSHGLKLGPDSILEIIDEGSGQGDMGRGAEYWIRVHRLISVNEGVFSSHLLSDNIQGETTYHFLCLFPPLDGDLPPKIPPDLAEAIPGGFRIPVDFSADGSLAPVEEGVRFEEDAIALLPSRALLDKLWERTEKQAQSGFFPLGASTTWHGGLHLPCRNGSAGEGQPVCAMADGEVIAARWKPRSGGGSGDAEGAWGSPNFVLLRHKLDAATAAQARSLHVTKGFGIKANKVVFPGVPDCPKLQTGDWLEVVSPDAAQACVKPGQSVKVRLSRLQASVSVLEGLTVVDAKVRLTLDAEGRESGPALMSGDRLRLEIKVDLESKAPPSGHLNVGLVEVVDALVEVTEWKISATTLSLRSSASTTPTIHSTTRRDTNRVTELYRDDLIELVDRAEAPVKQGTGKYRQEWRRVRVKGTDGGSQKEEATAVLKAIWTLREKANNSPDDAALRLSAGDKVRFLQRASVPKFDTVSVDSFASSEPAVYVLTRASSLRTAPDRALPEVTPVPAGARLEVTELTRRKGSVDYWVPVRFQPADGDAVDGWWLKTTNARPEERPRSTLPWCQRLIGEPYFVDALSSGLAKIEKEDRDVPEGAIGWINVREGCREHDGVHRKQVLEAFISPESGPLTPVLHLDWGSKLPKLGENNCPFEPWGMTRDVRFKDFIGREATITVDANVHAPTTGLPKDTESDLSDRIWYSLYSHLDDRQPLQAGSAASEALPWLPQFPESGKVSAGRPTLFADNAGARRLASLRPGDEVVFTGARNGHRYEVELTSVVAETEPTQLKITSTTVLWADEERRQPAGTLYPGDVMEFDRKPGLGVASVLVESAEPREEDRRYSILKEQRGKSLYGKPGENELHSVRQGDVFEVLAAPEMYKGRWNPVRVVECAKASLVGQICWMSRANLEKWLTPTDAAAGTPGLLRGNRTVNRGSGGFARWDASTFETFVVDRMAVLLRARGWVEFDRSHFNVKMKTDRVALDQLRAGKVIHLGVPTAGGKNAYTTVRAGETLGYVGLYGLDDADDPGEERRSQIHWEVFCEKNLFVHHARRNLAVTAADSSEDYNVDHPRLLGIVRAALDERETNLGKRFFADNLLEAKEVRAMYQGGGKVVETLRRSACRFVSEWGINVDLAVSALPSKKGRVHAWLFGEWAAAKQVRQIRYLVWWTEAKTAGVPIPASPCVWHFNPGAFLEFFSESEIERKSVPTGMSFDFVQGFEPLHLPDATDPLDGTDRVPEEEAEAVRPEEGPPPEQH